MNALRTLARELLWEPLCLKRSGIYTGLAPDVVDMALSYPFKRSQSFAGGSAFS